MAEQASRDGVIELVEERAVIGKRLVDSGGVRVSTRTEVQTEMVNAALQEFAVEAGLSSVYQLAHRLGLAWVTPRPKHPRGDAAAQAAFEQTSRPA